MFPLLQAAADIKIKCNDLFTINSITFNYFTTDMPDTNPYDSYVKIAKRSTVISKEKIKLDRATTRVPDKHIELSTREYQDNISFKQKELPKFIILKAGNPLDRFNKEK